MSICHAIKVSQGMKRSSEERREALKTFMSDNGLKPGPWADKAGVNRNTLYSFLRGQSDDMSAGTYEALANAAGVTVDQLLGHDDKIRVGILNAAERLLDEHRVNELTIKDVCEAASVEPRVFYGYFKDFRDLVAEVYFIQIEHSLSETKRKAISSGPAIERLAYIFRSMAKADLARPGLTRSIEAYAWEWSAEQEDKRHRYYLEIQELLLSVLKDAEQAGKIRSVNMTEFVRGISSRYLEELRIALVRELTEDDLADVMTTHARSMLTGIKTSTDDTWSNVVKAVKKAKSPTKKGVTRRRDAG